MAKTTAGTNFPSFKGDTYTGPSARCLSCHDGTVAIGDIAWWNAGKPALALDSSKLAWPDTHNVGATGGTPGSMKGNHPVAMPYPFGVRRTPITASPRQRGHVDGMADDQ